jgi:hypothetical protein
MVFSMRLIRLGYFLVAFLLYPSCGSVTEVSHVITPDAGIDAGPQHDATPMSGETHAEDKDGSEGGSDTNIDSSAGDVGQTVSPACVWGTVRPHVVAPCSDGRTAECFYTDVVGNRDGWISGCSSEGRECVERCPT